MKEEIEKIRKKIFDGKIPEGIVGLKEIIENVSDPALKNRLILACASYNTAIDSETSGLGNKTFDKNAAVLAILERLDEVELLSKKQNLPKDIGKLKDSELTSNQLIDLYKNLQENVSKLDSVEFQEKEKLYVQSIRLKKLMYSDTDKKLKEHYPRIIFNRLFFGENLEDIEINQLAQIPNDSTFLWHEKSTIVSGITLSCIRKFDPIKIDLLINFIMRFEDKVWQRALVGVVLSLKNREEKIKLFPEVVIKLEKLQEIEDVQNGIRMIAALLNRESYKGCFLWQWRRFMNPQSFSILGQVEQWFIPFYKNNPIIEKVKEEFPNIPKIDEVPELLTNDRHLSNSQKYAIALELPSWEREKVIRFIKSLQGGANCTREHIFDPYITDFFWFYKLFPRKDFENIFQSKINLYKTSLVDILISENKRSLFPAIVEIKSGNFNKGVLMMKDKSDAELKTYFDSFDIALIKYHLSRYNESILAFERELEVNDNAVIHSNLGFLYFVLGNDEKSNFHIEKALEGDEQFFSNKNLGYHHLKKKNLRKAMKNFLICVNTEGNNKRLITSFNAEFKHISKQIGLKTLRDAQTQIKLLRSNN